MNDEPSQPLELELSEIGQLGIAVSDLERATAFYRDVLGVPFLFAAGGMAFFQSGDTRLMLGQASDNGMDEHEHILYFRVPDIHAACDALKQLGVGMEQGPVRAHRDDDHELWIAFFRDSEGNRRALMSEVALA